MSGNNFYNQKPKAMLEFLNRFGSKGELPATFSSGENEFLLSIQYLFTDCWSNRFDPTNNLLRFAVNTDGWDLLVNVQDKELVILQDEMGDVDSIDITIFDLLNAKVEKM
ncbi:hypothetical protein FT643_15780 [Ketobacter sp. MCCC 1A13808]|uniref:hypothetical protein n=1 Tax=Ketobacter sp. MCCC 1A13808 TaxID=2602738 RepID=UPI0012EC230B|nr:hypothetical protein [Ketobacter sp. MCCC 1A13808]MVF13602.1 hypothetical protein [Ketobacter sp. MCCC 1A13808]